MGNVLMPSTSRAVGTSSLATRQETASFLNCILDTISQARAPSTRHLYASKWSVFSAWSSNHGKDSSVCDVSVILSFMEELLDKVRSPSTLKV